jgi:hypothetical protein
LDPTKADRFYAPIELGSYLDFTRPVPFREGDRYDESGLRRDDGETHHRNPGKQLAATKSIIGAIPGGAIGR